MGRLNARVMETACKHRGIEGACRETASKVGGDELASMAGRPASQTSPHLKRCNDSFVKEVILIL